MNYKNLKVLKHSKAFLNRLELNLEGIIRGCFWVLLKRSGIENEYQLEWFGKILGKFLG